MPIFHVLNQRRMHGMHGIQRLPALMYYNPHTDIQQINLQTYEIIFTEPLHDISNHIKNLNTELPYHIEKQHRKSLNFIINNSFGGKEAKNSSDYRKCLLVVTEWLQENHKSHMIRDILITLSEAQEIMYLPDNQRSPQTVLRLYLVMFFHMPFIKINGRGKVKKLTNRKLFGSYYHSLNCHSSQQY